MLMKRFQIKLGVSLFALLLAWLMLGFDKTIALWIATKLPQQLIPPLNILTSCLDATFVFFVLLLVFLVTLCWLYLTPHLTHRLKLQTAMTFSLKAFAVLLAAACVMPLLKVSFGRLRPHFLLQTGEYLFRPFCRYGGASSFPSGHAQVAGSLSALAYHTVANHSKYLFVMVGLLLASTRVWLNHHFLSDVLAGFALGWLLVIGLNWLLRRLGDMYPHKALLCVLDKYWPMPKVKPYAHLTHVA
jgi:membrane-associated phospholipid phosphatase